MKNEPPENSGRSPLRGWARDEDLHSPGKISNQWVYIGQEALVSPYAGYNPWEDFAETFTAWVYEKNGQTYQDPIQPKHRAALMAALSVFGVIQ